MAKFTKCKCSCAAQTAMNSTILFKLENINTLNCLRTRVARHHWHWLCWPQNVCTKYVVLEFIVAAQTHTKNKRNNDLLVAKLWCKMQMLGECARAQNNFRNKCKRREHLIATAARPHNSARRNFSCENAVQWCFISLQNTNVKKYKKKNINREKKKDQSHCHCHALPFFSLDLFTLLDAHMWRWMNLDL